MRPGGTNPRIEDARIEFDPSFFFDSKALEGGVRSAMWEPFRSTNTLRGGVWLASYVPHAFADEHQEVLRRSPRCWAPPSNTGGFGHRAPPPDRLDRIEMLLSTLAESLDVREFSGGFPTGCSRFCRTT